MFDIFAFIISFRDKLNVARSSLSNGDNTVNTHYICNFCFRRISLSKSTYHNNICDIRKIYCPSSSESELSTDDSSSSEEVTFEYEEKVHEEEENHEDEEEVHEEEEEEVHEDEEEVHKENRNQLPIDIDEDDEKQAEDGPVEQENKREEIPAKEAEEVEDEIPEKDAQQEAKKKNPEIFRQFTIDKKIIIVEL